MHIPSGAFHKCPSTPVRSHEVPCSVHVTMVFYEHRLACVVLQSAQAPGISRRHFPDVTFPRDSKAMVWFVGRLRQWAKTSLRISGARGSKQDHTCWSRDHDNGLGEVSRGTGASNVAAIIAHQPGHTIHYLLLPYHHYLGPSPPNLPNKHDYASA